MNECSVAVPQIDQATAQAQKAAIQALRSGERRVPRNSQLLRLNEPGPRLRTLISGWAFRCRTFSDGRRQIIGVLLPGDTFGIESLFCDGLGCLVWSATIVTYAIMDPDATMRLFDAEPWFRRRLMRALADDKADVERWMAQLGRCDAEERTAALLLLLHERLRARDMVSGHTFRLELTQQELADLLGLHLIHLNRVLSRLRARGLIMMHGQEVTLLDPDGLEDLVPVPGQYARANDPL